MTPSRLAFVLTAAGLAAGLAAQLVGWAAAATLAWAATTALALVPLAYTVMRGLFRGKAGVDFIALLAMGGALILHEYLAGAVIALMLTGGRALEDFATSRARRELSALVQRTPRIVHRYEGEAIVSAGIETVRPGDILLVKPGEVVPVDGIVASSAAVLDEAALTGEADPVERRNGDKVRSGPTNAARTPFDLRATTTAEQSTYAGIVRLVQQAQDSKAPLVRLADRYALFFLPLTLLVAGIAWMISGDPVRALAVLVVATPCPLILAAPIAIVAGISRAAHRGIIVKGGGALETLARGKTLILDKTGTVTAGSPALTNIESFGKYSPDRLLELAASLDQVSPHVLAGPILKAAAKKKAGTPVSKRRVGRTRVWYPGPGRRAEYRVGQKRVAASRRCAARGPPPFASSHALGRIVRRLHICRRRRGRRSDPGRSRSNGCTLDTAGAAARRFRTDCDAHRRS